MLPWGVKNILMNRRFWTTTSFQDKPIITYKKVAHLNISRSIWSKSGKINKSESILGVIMIWCSRRPCKHTLTRYLNAYDQTINLLSLCFSSDMKCAYLHVYSSLVEMSVIPIEKHEKVKKAARNVTDEVTSSSGIIQSGTTSIS